MKVMLEVLNGFHQNLRIQTIMKLNRKKITSLISKLLWNGSVILIVTAVACAQKEKTTRKPPPTRPHTINKSIGQLELIPSRVQSPTANIVSISMEDSFRVIRANGIPNHLTGAFPNNDNPNKINEQNYVIKIPAHPLLADQIRPLGMHTFGIAVNGVPFDPGAAEWYLGNRRGRWQYEALSGAIKLGLDESHGHVQPNGAYHYHALPTLLTNHTTLNESVHSPIIGWAADGFPIYALYGYVDSGDAKSGITTLRSSHRLKIGKRPEGDNHPGGIYDGTFVTDYEYVEELGELDQCNGRITVTPEFPESTYAYYLTESWPVIPRCYKGTPSSNFTRDHRNPRPR